MPGRVEDDEIVAEAVHLDESQLHGATLNDSTKLRNHSSMAKACGFVALRARHLYFHSLT